MSLSSLSIYTKSKKTFLSKHLLEVTFLSLAVTSIIVGILANNFYPYTLFSDDAVYMNMARFLSEGDWTKILHPMWSPFFPIAIFLSNLFINNWAISVRIIPLIFGALLFIPIFLLVKKVGSLLEATIASLLVIFFKPLVTLSSRPLSDVVLAFFIWLGIYLCWKAITEKNYLCAMTAGLSLSMAYLTKNEGVFVLAGFFLFILFSLVSNLCSKFVTRGHLILIAASILAGFLPLFLCYNLLMFSRFGINYSSAKLGAIYNIYTAFDLNKTGTSTWAQDAWSLRTFDINSEFMSYPGLKKHIQRELFFEGTKQRFLGNIKLISGYFSPFLMLLVILGVGWTLIKQTGRPLLALLAFCNLVMFAAITFYAPGIKERYIGWSFPFILVFLGVGISKVLEILQPRFLMITFVILLTLSFIYIPNGDRFFFINPAVTDASSTQEIDQWLLNNNDGSRIMTGHEGLVFFSRGFVIYTPQVATLEQLVEYAKLWHTQYLVAARGEIPSVLEYLYQTPKDYPDMKIVYRNDNKQAYLYKFINK